MDEEARRARLEIMIERRIVMEEKRNKAREHTNTRHQAFLERQAQSRGLRKAEQNELQRLRQETLAENQELRKIMQEARVVMWQIQRDEPERAEKIRQEMQAARAEMKRLYQDDSEEAKQKRAQLQLARRQRFESFIARTQDFIQRERAAEAEILAEVAQMEETFEAEMAQFRETWQKMQSGTDEDK